MSTFFKDKNLDNLNKNDASFQTSQKSLEGLVYIRNLSETMIYEEYS